MPVTAVIGAQFGDEAKGKVSDFLAAGHALVVRSGGGPNAGHSIYPHEQPLVLHQLPCGVLRTGCTGVSGPGMVINPTSLVQEIGDIRALGEFRGEFLLSDRAHVILPWHQRQDAWEEQVRGPRAAGTTGRGIGPAYMDRASRFGLRVADLLRPDVLTDKLTLLLSTKRHITDGAPDVPDPATVRGELLAAAEALRPHVRSTEPVLWQALREGRPLLLEGAQSALLDVDFGTYPYVTSSHPTSAGALVGSGIPPQELTEVIGVAKAYCTRVGEGPFPAEASSGDAERLRTRGGEKGATTGRPRRCGWMDLVLLRYAARLNGFTSLAITKVDVLGGDAEVPVCTGYELADGSVAEEMPPTLSEDLEKVRPIWKYLPGWPEMGPATEARLVEEGYRALPRELKRYLAFLARETGVPISLVSYGPHRSQTVLVPPNAFQGPGAMEAWHGA